MRIVDLTEEFIEHVLHNHDPEGYEAVFPDLFAHYFAFWTRRQTYSPELTEQYVRQQAALIKESLLSFADRFAESGVALDDLEVVLFVGCMGSSGHAFKKDNSFVVWIPIERYPSKLTVEVFVPHEIAHALHYQNTPVFYFNTAEEKHRVSRQIITEGVATFVSMAVMNFDAKTALWADYLSKEQVDLWFQECLRQEELMNRYVLDNFHEQNVDLFTLREGDDVGNVLHFRGGYYVGLRLVERIVQARRLATSDIFSLSREEFEYIALERLRKG